MSSLHSAPLCGPGRVTASLCLPPCGTANRAASWNPAEASKMVGEKQFASPGNVGALGSQVGMG